MRRAETDKIILGLLQKSPDLKELVSEENLKLKQAAPPPASG